VLLLDDGVVQFHHHGFVKKIIFLFFLFHYIEIFFLVFLNFPYFVIYVVFSFSFSISSFDQPTSKKLCYENVQDSIDEIIIDFVFQLSVRDRSEFFDVEFSGSNHVTPSILNIVTSTPSTNHYTFKLLQSNDGSKIYLQPLKFISPHFHEMNDSNASLFVDFYNFVVSLDINIHVRPSDGSMLSLDSNVHVGPSDGYS
jgi:hypothetical protein